MTKQFSLDVMYLGGLSLTMSAAITNAKATDGMVDILYS